MKEVDPINEEHFQDVVNEKDEVIGKTSKKDKFKKELITRNVVVFLKDADDKFIIVKRSPNKKSFPNVYDLAACGHVMVGESYEDAIKREIMEELSIECDVDLIQIFYHEHPENGKQVKYFTGVFTGKSQDEIKANEEFLVMPSMTFAELDESIKRTPELFTPFFVDEFHEFRDILKEENA